MAKEQEGEVWVTPAQDLQVLKLLAERITVVLQRCLVQEYL